MAHHKQLLNFYGFLREHGIIWGPEPEAYEPVNGHYTYGPFGKALKNEVESYIRHVFNSNEYNEIECPLIYPKVVWEKSGHWNKFNDPIIHSKDGNIHRLDKLIEEHFPDVNFATLTPKQIQEYVVKIKDDTLIPTDEIQYRSLMMQTHSGSTLCALRPETATTTYLSFQSAYKYYNKLPMRLYQIGKAFRNEINPKQNIIRCREFVQAEAHIFIDEKEKVKCPSYDPTRVIPVLTSYGISSLTLGQCIEQKMFQTEYYAHTVYLAYSIFKNAGFPESRIRLRRHADDEKAFYALEAWDVEIDLHNLGWIEVCGVHDRGCYDLTQHGCKLSSIPHIIELAMGVDRFVFSLLDTFYEKKDIEAGKSTFRIPAFLAPYQIAIFPLTKKDKQIETSKMIYDMLKKDYEVIYDDKQSIGKRYLKAGIKGVPFCITVDQQTEEDNTVTVRDRDTEVQVRYSIAVLQKLFAEKF